MQRKIKIFTMAMVLVLGVFALATFVGCNNKTVENITITVQMDEIQLEVGQSQKLAVSIEPFDAMDKTVTWESSDQAIAKVENGTVTAVAEGEAIITVTSNGKSDTCKVIVSSSGAPSTPEEGGGNNQEQGTPEGENGGNA